MIPGIVFPTFTSLNVASISFSFEGSAGIAGKKFLRLAEDVDSLEEPLTRSVRDVVIPSIMMNFRKYGRPRWAPILPETAAQKGGSFVPLVRDGSLKATMGSLDIWRIDNEKALIPNLPADVWYGVVHQTGASFSGSKGASGGTVRIVGLGSSSRTAQVTDTSGGGEIPARPFAVIQPEDEEAIEEIFNEWLGERINAAGLGPSRSI